MSIAPVSVVLAAGKSTRMKSALPKVLHEVCGRPMIDYVLDAAREAGVSRQVVIVGHAARRSPAESLGIAAAIVSRGTSTRPSAATPSKSAIARNAGPARRRTPPNGCRAVAPRTLFGTAALMYLRGLQGCGLHTHGAYAL